MAFAVLVWVTIGFVVFCADSVGEEAHRPAVQLTVRAVCWPATLGTWFTHRTVPKLARFGAIVWLGVTTGWLVSLERDQISSLAWFGGAFEATMAFVVWCVDAMSADLGRKPLRRAARSLVWPKPLVEFLRDPDSIRIIQASVTVWVLLTTGWLIGLEADRLGRPLGWLA